MREVKFRAWSPLHQVMFGDGCSGEDYYFSFLGSSLELNTLEERWCSGSGEWQSSYEYVPQSAAIFIQYTGFQDSNGVELYEKDVVYLAGYGLYECEFPFIELYEAAMENDIGELIGNTHEHPELIK